MVQWSGVCAFTAAEGREKKTQETEEGGDRTEH